MIKLYTPTIEAFMLEALRTEEPVIYVHEYHELDTKHRNIAVMQYFICLNCINDTEQIIEFIALIDSHLPLDDKGGIKLKALSKKYRERIEAGLKKRNFTDIRPGYYSDASIFGELPVLKGIKK